MFLLLIESGLKERCSARGDLGGQVEWNEEGQVAVDPYGSPVFAASREVKNSVTSRAWKTPSPLKTPTKVTEYQTCML